MRLPPPSTAWRIAACKRFGTRVALGKLASRLRSVRAIQWSNSAELTSAVQRRRFEGFCKLGAGRVGQQANT